MFLYSNTFSVQIFQEDYIPKLKTPRGPLPVDTEDENIVDSSGKNKKNQIEGESSKEAQSTDEKKQSMKNIQNHGYLVSKIKATKIINGCI